MGATGGRRLREKGGPLPGNKQPVEAHLCQLHQEKACCPPLQWAAGRLPANSASACNQQQTHALLYCLLVGAAQCLGAAGPEGNVFVCVAQPDFLCS